MTDDIEQGGGEDEKAGGIGLSLVGEKRSYTAAQMNHAVALAYSYGYPDVEGAVSNAAEITGIPRQTLMGWCNGRRALEQVTPESVHAAKRNLQEMLEQIAGMYLERVANENLAKQTGAVQAMKTASIALENLRALDMLDERVKRVLPDFIGALTYLGRSPEVFMEQVIQAAVERGYIVLPPRGYGESRT